MKPTPHASRRRALLLFLFLSPPLLLVAPPCATRATQQTSPATNAATTAQLAPDTSATLKLIVTVTDEKGRFVSALTKEAFAVFEGKLAREISHFDSADAPLSVGILIDVSRSVESHAIDAARRMAANFIRQSHPENEYFVAEFNDKWRELTAWTRDPQEIVNGLRGVGTAGAKDGRKSKPRGYTALYDACSGALEKMARAAHGKRALLILTDGGQDNASTHKPDELRRLLATSGVLLYALAHSDPRNGIDFEGQSHLYELADGTGGRAYFVDDGVWADDIIARIALELRQQYVVGFTPTYAAQSGKWNKVKIKVTPPQKFIKKVGVRSREKYLSPAPAP